ncbi:purine-cytosine permease family protein [Paraburkholderia tropica]|uniref:purine-cytosine permease family protein n=1 Tax=Paraburkholderia tropica TaxID=92647 RepID=UPI002AB217F0|nr:purine-cytosine permease-like transporter [Paraburkholderia tropica]
MNTQQDLSTQIEDHALEAVPAHARQGWAKLSWNTAGLVTTLVQMFIGALITFVAGIKIALIAGALVTVIGSLLGWGVGHVAYRTGLSSTVLTRKHGFGQRGSSITAFAFAFMITGLAALENVLLYKGFMFWFGFADTALNEVIVYGLLSLAWIGLTAFGFKLVSRVSTVTLTAVIILMIYMIVKIVSGSGMSWGHAMSFGPQMPADILRQMAALTDFGKFAFCVNVLIGTAGALAMIDADLGRYARTSRDIAVAAFVGNIFLDFIMIAVGGVIMYAGSAQLIAHYVAHGMTEAQASTAVLNSPDSVASAFIVFGGTIGGVLMFLAQAKTQVINSYSSSLSLTSFFDSTLGWRPGRFTFLVLANVISALFLAGSILNWFNAFITVLGVLMTCFAGIIIADFYIVNRGRSDIPVPGINWAGVITTVVAFMMAHFVLNTLIPIEFFTSLIGSLVLYPALRLRSVRQAVASTQL